MAKRNRKKITVTDVKKAMQYAQEITMQAAGVVLIQDHGFTTETMGEFVREVTTLYFDMLQGKPLSEDRQAKADKLRAERVKEIEAQNLTDK